MMRFCAYQDRSEGEVRDKIASLKMENVDEEKIIQYLVDERFIDDQRFAENYVQSKLRLKGWGRLKLRSQLFQKGISSSIVSQVISTISENTYKDACRKHIEKWLRMNRIEDRDFTKIYRFLESKGFERDFIFRHCEAMVKEIGDESIIK